MARVTINHIERWEWPDGDVGCRLDLVSQEQQQPQIVPQPKDEEAAKIADQIGSIIQSTVQKMGMRPPNTISIMNPKIVFFLRSDEYEAIGKPTINDVYELSFDRSTSRENTDILSITLKEV